MKKLLASAILLLSVSSLFAQSIDITQIENRRLLIDGTLDLFFLPRDADGNPRTLDGSEKIQLYIPDAKGNMKEQKIRSIEQEAPEQQGISFLLLLDNSGSMHKWNIGDESRYQTAVHAVESFLSSIDNPLDKIGIASFNTYYTPLSPIAGISGTQKSSLQKIQEPADDEAFTELYLSMDKASAELAAFTGRRAMIVLSDGENYPYSLSGSEHPLYAGEETAPDEVIEKMLEEGISIYAVHIGADRDPELSRIAEATGGRSFDATDREQLENVYSTIREEIRKEYRVRFRPSYSRTEVNDIILKVDNQESQSAFYVPHFLGLPENGFSWLFLIPLLLAAGIIAAMLLLVWEHAAKSAEINILNTDKPFSQVTRVNLTNEVTVIGAGDRADMTVAGNPSLRESHATIVYDKTVGNYTVAADDEFKVNNRFKKQHILKSGDVLDFNGTVVVFDKPEEK